MSEYSTEDRSSRIEQRVARVKRASTTVAMVTSPAFIQVERVSAPLTMGKGQMATQADIDAFWNKAALHLKPHFDAVTANTSAHIDKELAPLRQAMSDLAPMKVTLGEHGRSLETIVDSLRNVQLALDAIREKLG